jgi:5-methylcytosine-specific restriction endonuclease McrA
LNPWHKKDRFKEINANRARHQRYYQSSMHKRWRLLILAEHPLCTECLKQNRVEPSTVADHIESLTDCWDKRNWLSNGTGLCDRCHNIKSRSEQIEYKKREQQLRIDERMNDLNEF